jgi:glycosyltransferase involved in cell wall biosynthesis
MLERFYTDACGSVGIGSVAGALKYLPVVGSSFGRLRSRQLPPELVSKTRTFAGPAIRRSLDAWRTHGDSTKAVRRSRAFSDRWGAAMVRAGFGRATHVFSMLGEGGPFLAEAKSRGLTVISEVYILLSTLRIVAAERRAFPEWEPAEDPEAIEEMEQSAREGLLSNSDFFVCPSPAVRDDLVANWGVDGARVAVVPYGVDPRWLELESRPQPRRVLFVGTADLRKGIHYLAMAAERLAAAGKSCEFRVAGHVMPQVAARPECQQLNFLGRVPRTRIQEEFQQADVFVLPSLAEGSAEVTYEALAAGLPVITTAASGSVVRNGIDGRIVSERNVRSLTAAIAETVSDRRRRDEMATAARARAAEYTWPLYGERLLHALASFDS